MTTIIFILFYYDLLGIEQDGFIRLEISITFTNCRTTNVIVYESSGHYRGAFSSKFDKFFEIKTENEKRKNDHATSSPQNVSVKISFFKIILLHVH